MARPPALQASIRALSNPYAAIQFEEGDSDAMNLAHRQHASGGNPYARIQTEDDEHLPGPEGFAKPPTSLIPAGGLNAIEFEGASRAIFRQYIPAEERGRLRDHHRAFIERNRASSPRMRLALVRQLRRYDLSDIKGLAAQFNRETYDFTVDKLQEIERRAAKEDDDATGE
jgi:hypothetical protein